MTDSTMLKKIIHHALIEFVTKQEKTQKVIHDKMLAI